MIPGVIDATFYRRLQRWPEVCGGLAKAPKVPDVGYLHVENFGSWLALERQLKIPATFLHAY